MTEDCEGARAEFAQIAVRRPSASIWLDRQTNASCCRDVSADSWRCGFGHVGVCFQMRDIEPGMEVTCDYTLFEWDCSDKGIDACGCEQRPQPTP